MLSVFEKITIRIYFKFCWDIYCNCNAIHLSGTGPRLRGTCRVYIFPVMHSKMFNGRLLNDKRVQGVNLFNMLKIVIISSSCFLSLFRSFRAFDVDKAFWENVHTAIFSLIVNKSYKVNVCYKCLE